MLRRCLLPLLPLFAAPLFATSCGHASSPPAPAPPAPFTRTDPAAVHVSGRAFRDGLGRQLLFRGYNAKVNGIFDVTFDDGRTPNYVFKSFDEAGAARFEELGFDVLRLCVDWSALEPHPLAYDQDFFAKVDAVVAMAREHHFYVFLDMHQDAYSKEIGEDGEPLWAITPPPTMLLQGPSNDGRRLTAQVINAGVSFFDDAPAQDGRALQDAFGAAVSQMVQRYLGDPVVLGVEAFNEPVLFELPDLDAFHAALADRLHAIDADMPFLFEPIGTRNETDQAAIPGAPFAHGPGVYAPHIYTGWFSIPDQMGWSSEDPAKLGPSMVAAEAEATAWGTPLFITELGCDQTVARGPVWLSDELDLQDQELASSTVWGWESGDWGITDDGGTERPATVHVVSRSYPRAVAGDLLAIERPAPGHMLVRYQATDATRGLPHEVSVSTEYLTGYEVLCDGVKVAVTASTGRAAFTCPGADGAHTFEVIGTPVE